MVIPIWILFAGTPTMTGNEIMEQVESFHRRFVHYPESVHADKIYQNRENRRSCKGNGIRLSGPPLGRPPKDQEIRELPRS